MAEVRVIGLTQPGTIGFDGNYFDPNVKTPEDILVYCARVSNPANQANMDTGAKLLAYCIKNKHWSVFETVSMTMEITTTRDIARQVLRHRSFSFQEFSQRYAEVQAFEYREARLQDNKNRQNSIETDDDNLQSEWWIKQDVVLDLVKKNYKWALDNGIAKEQARAILPEGMTQSRLYMQGSLRSWMHWIELRTKKGTQVEHMELAEMARERVLRHFPSLKIFFYPE
jgi:thymidylate synthase (FAD)